MGCCSIRIQKNLKTVVTLATCTKELSGQREGLLSKIFFLHSLILDCNTRIETFLIEEQKDWAFLLKSKKISIKAISKQIQQLISRIDECLEDAQANKSERDDIKNEITKIEKALKTSPLYQDNNLLDENHEDYINTLKSAISSIDINKQKLITEIEQEMQEYKKKNDERGSVIRRKYTRSRQSV